MSLELYFAKEGITAAIDTASNSLSLACLLEDIIPAMARDKISTLRSYLDVLFSTYKLPDLVEDNLSDEENNTSPQQILKKYSLESEAQKTALLIFLGKKYLHKEECTHADGSFFNLYKELEKQPMPYNPTLKKTYVNLMNEVYEQIPKQSPKLERQKQALAGINSSTNNQIQESVLYSDLQLQKREEKVDFNHEKSFAENNLLQISPVAKEENKPIFGKNENAFKNKIDDKTILKNITNILLKNSFLQKPLYEGRKIRILSNGLDEDIGYREIKVTNAAWVALKYIKHEENKPHHEENTLNNLDMLFKKASKNSKFWRSKNKQVFYGNLSNSRDYFRNQKLLEKIRQQILQKTKWEINGKFSGNYIQFSNERSETIRIKVPAHVRTILEYIDDAINLRLTMQDAVKSIRGMLAYTIENRTPSRAQSTQEWYISLKQLIDAELETESAQSTEILPIRALSYCY